ncbi:MAG: hypothetical protein ACE5EQ_08730 [Phycisphaerae bacterium]
MRIQVRQDGTSMDAAHGHPSGLNVLSALVPNLNDEHTFFGSFYRRVTAADSSTYQIWVACDTSNRFDAEDGFLYVQSIQYPT